MFVTALLLGLVGVFCILDSRILGRMNFERPLITCTIVGALLGDLQTGLTLGASIELMSLGIVNIGAAAPPDMNMAAIICAAFAILTDASAETALALAIPIAVLGQMLRRALLNIYSRDFHPATEIEINLFNEIWAKMDKAAKEGFSKSKAITPDEDFRNAILRNNAVFSAFKVHRMQNDMARLLLDSNGILKPFDKWVQEVLPIASHQVRHWLRTEYDTAVIRAHQAADAKNYEAYIPTEKHTKSFEELQKINPDIIGWIRINETNVNYPLLQAEDDDTYMNTDAEGKYSLSGSIFLHCANKPDFSDFNNMIYGHHMEKHMMFGDVGLFADKEYFDEHPYGNLFFDGKDHGIEFYALIQADAYNERLFSVSSEEPEAKQAYLQEISDNALYKRNFELTENDHLVLLITCTSDMTNGRNILVGRLTDQVYPEKEKAKNLGTGIDKLKEKMIQVPIIYWILLLIIVLLLIDRKLKKKGKKKHENP